MDGSATLTMTASRVITKNPSNAAANAALGRGSTLGVGATGAGRRRGRLLTLRRASDEFSHRISGGRGGSSLSRDTIDATPSRAAGRSGLRGYQLDPPSARPAVVPSTTWTTGPRFASSWPPGAPSSPPSRSGCPRAAASGGCPGCAARRSPCWPGSAPTGTSGWRRATSAASPRTSSTPSPAPCSSTRPNGPTCSTSPEPRNPPAPPAGSTATQVRPSVQRVVDSMAGTPAFVRNGRLDLLAINALGRALYAPVFDDPAATRRNLARFILPRPARPRLLPRLGRRRRTPPSRCCAPRPGATRTTAT